MGTKKWFQKEGRRFTLIELMIVIVIMIILMALLLPALSRMRERSRRIVCTSRLRQLLIASHLYADEFDNYYPRGRKYDSSTNLAENLRDIRPSTVQYFLTNYLGSDKRLLGCPNQEEFNLPLYLEDAPGCWTWRMGYLYSGDKPRLNQTYGYRFPDKRDREHSQNIMLWMDSNNWSQTWAGTMVAHTVSGGRKFSFPVDLETTIPLVDGANVGYLDGSVHWLPHAELTTYDIYWDGASGRRKALLPKNMW